MRKTTLWVLSEQVVITGQLKLVKKFKLYGLVHVHVVESFGYGILNAFFPLYFNWAVRVRVLCGVEVPPTTEKQHV